MKLNASAGAGLAGALAFLVFSAGLAGPAQAQNLSQCGSYPNADATYACLCPANVSSGSVWGDNPYTSDSNVCRAALHAGVISSAGGPVYLERRDGQQSYAGTTSNGVQTSSWGSYHTSYTFVKGPSSGVPCSGYPTGEASYSCDCDGSEDGWVWGSGPYTSDSDICVAAKHAGVIGANGGSVTALGLMGLGSYTGSESNGVSTSNWGSYSSSFVFNAN